MAGGVDGCKKGLDFSTATSIAAGFGGGVTQLPGDATAVIGCWTWVKRAFILPMLDLANNVRDGLVSKEAVRELYRFDI